MTDQLVRIIGGLPGDVIEFTQRGKYVFWLDNHRKLDSCYSTSVDKGLNGLDVWIEDLEPLGAKCIYRIDGSMLTICVAGNSGERPKEFRRDDQLLWCLRMLERCESPATTRRKRSAPRKSSPKN